MGIVALTEDVINTNKIQVWKFQGKRSHGRPRHIWEIWVCMVDLGIRGRPGYTQET